MYKPEVIEYFGTLEKVATALGISVSAVSQWGTMRIACKRLQKGS